MTLVPPAPPAARTVWQLAAGPPLGLFRQVNGSPHGLTEADASHRLACDGENRVGPRAPATFTASVRRRASPTSAAKVREVPVEDLVVGDVVLLATGDPVPADLRLLTTSGLTVDQSPLSGLVDMVPKWAPELGPSAMATVSPLDERALCFAGTVVTAGHAMSVVIATGEHTYLGRFGTCAPSAAR